MSASAIARLPQLGPSRGEVEGKDVLCPAPHCSPSRATASDSRPGHQAGAPWPMVYGEGCPATSASAMGGQLAKVFLETLYRHRPENAHNKHSHL